MLKVLHVMRSPVGGLFRHVCDLAREQSRMGVATGIICDNLTGGEPAMRALLEMQEICQSGVHRIAIPRLPSLADIGNIGKAAALARATGSTILHGHGAKGGLYARLAARRCKVPAVYTAHGGSLHYSWASPQGAVFLGMEWLQARLSSNMIFVCDFERQLFEAKLGKPGAASTVIYNGLKAEEFDEVPLDPDALDFIFVGEMRKLKGVDVLLEALSQVPGVSLALVGSGPDLGEFQSQSQRLKLEDRVRFLGQMPMRRALAKGKVLVVPSRNESYPYVVLEALAAGRQVFASNVGGIPEILPQKCLFPAGNAGALRDMLLSAQKSNNDFNEMFVETRRKLAQNNTTAEMARNTVQFYSQLKN